jgi:hypothetical protein
VSFNQELTALFKYRQSFELFKDPFSRSIIVLSLLFRVVWQIFSLAFSLFVVIVLSVEFLRGIVHCIIHSVYLQLRGFRIVEVIVDLWLWLNLNRAYSCLEMVLWNSGRYFCVSSQLGDG